MVADTGPLNYLVMIDQIALIPQIFESVSIPEAVRLELLHPSAPAEVRLWIEAPPEWLSVERNPDSTAQEFAELDVGERAAIALALQQNADLLVMDDRAAVSLARRKDLIVVGTIGILDMGARGGIIDVKEAVRRLRATNFHCRARLLDDLLAQHETG